MDIRERVPNKGQVITLYNICDALNVEKDIYKYRGITADELKGMFEVSLRKQGMGVANNDFFEYSDNLKVERNEHAKEDEPKEDEVVDNKEDDNNTEEVVA